MSNFGKWFAISLTIVVSGCSFINGNNGKDSYREAKIAQELLIPDDLSVKPKGESAFAIPQGPVLAKDLPPVSLYPPEFATLAPKPIANN